MQVGVPKEVKNRQYRVALNRIGVHELVPHDHSLAVELNTHAGVLTNAMVGQALDIVTVPLEEVPA